MSVPRFFFFQAEDGIRDLVRSRGLGDVYKRQQHARRYRGVSMRENALIAQPHAIAASGGRDWRPGCLLYTSDAADERSSVDLGGRRIIKKKKTQAILGSDSRRTNTQTT